MQSEHSVALVLNPNWHTGKLQNVYSGISKLQRTWSLGLMGQSSPWIWTSMDIPMPDGPRILITPGPLLVSYLWAIVDISPGPANNKAWSRSLLQNQSILDSVMLGSILMASNLLRWNWTSTKGANPAILWQSSCYNLISGSIVLSTNQTHPTEISLCPGWPCWKRRSNCLLRSNQEHGGRHTHEATHERPILEVH